MCYSKEVSLATSGAIFASSGYAWWRFYHRDGKTAAKKVDPRVREFIKYSIIAFATIGGHQLFEFLSIWSGNQIVYKVGLLLSISCTYFLIRALEKLTGRNFGSKAAIAVIAGLGLYMFGKDMQFENAHFYVRGFSHYAWSMTWMMLFIYWNLCVVAAAHQMKLGKTRTLLLVYPWVFTNSTYALMLLYALTAMANQQSITVASVLTCAGLSNTFSDYQGVYDLASIWCALAFLSSLCIPTYFRAVLRDANPKELDGVRGISLTHAIVFAGLAGTILLFLNYYLPIFSYIGLKMFTK